MKLAVLIDADNIGVNYAPEVFTKVAELGEAITRRAFGNITAFSGNDSWKEAVRQYAIEAKALVSNVDRKNTADFALIIDAMDCLASGKYDGFVLVSSDSDFTSLAQRLRNDDKVVYGIGDQRASVSFRKACTRFYDLTAAVVETKADPETPKMASQDPPVNARGVKPASQKAAKPSGQPITGHQKEPASFKPLVANVQKQKCRKETALMKTLTVNLKQPEEKAKEIINWMKAEKIIGVDANGKIDWLEAQS